MTCPITICVKKDLYMQMNLRPYGGYGLVFAETGLAGLNLSLYGTFPI